MSLLIVFPFIVAFIVAIFLLYNGINEKNYAKVVAACIIGFFSALVVHHLGSNNQKSKLIA